MSPQHPQVLDTGLSRGVGSFEFTYKVHFLLFKQLIFNSLTNCLGPRKLLHSGKLYKTKSNKELHGFLFNDFLLLTYMVRQFAASSGSEKLFSSKSSAQFKMYKTVSPPICRRWDLHLSTPSHLGLPCSHGLFACFRRWPVVSFAAS